MEACRIVITEVVNGQYDVGAPMKHKDLCYEIIRDARVVIRLSPDTCFHAAQKTLTIMMDMRGVIDVTAPLPSRDKCEALLRGGRMMIEKYNDDQAPVLRAFSGQLVGDHHADSLSAT